MRSIVFSREMEERKHNALLEEDRLRYRAATNPSQYPVPVSKEKARAKDHKRQRKWKWHRE
jgi:hypothetical protein